MDDDVEIDHRHWGEFASDDESEEESAEEEEEDVGEALPPPESGFTTPATTEGFATPSGMGTVPGIETPSSSIEIRKKKTTDDRFCLFERYLWFYTHF
jgi:hypothetical protein